jgi:hypothetical protein
MNKQAAYEAGMVFALADAGLAPDGHIKQAYNALLGTGLRDDLSARDASITNLGGMGGSALGVGAGLGAGVGGAKLLDSLAARNAAGRAAELAHTRSGAQMLGGSMEHLLENVRSGAGGGARAIGAAPKSTILSRLGGRSSQALAKMNPKLRAALLVGGLGGLGFGGAQLAGQATEDALDA